MASLGLQIASLLASLLIGGCLVGWGYAAVRWARGRPLLAAEPRLYPNWQFTELLLCFGIYMVMVIVLQGALLRPAAPSAAAASSRPAAVQLQAPVGPDLPPHPGPAGRPLDKKTLGLAITADGIAKVLAIAAVLLWMTLLDRRSAERLGLWVTGRDLKIGLVASAMLLPPVLAVQAATTLLIEYQHPVLDIIQQGPGLWLGLAMAVSTVAVAPVAEEFFFRGLLQGWLQRRGEPGDVRPQSIAVGLPGPTEGASARAADGTAATAEVQQIGPEREEALRLLSPSPDVDPALISGQQVSHWPWWPVVVSSLLFAVVHVGQGAAPLSLFLLALGLGYLYRQTGRLAAPIMVHMILNGLSTAITFLTAAAGEGGVP